jgi:wobble nucleotide-excising tRNase
VRSKNLGSAIPAEECGVNGSQGNMKIERITKIKNHPIFRDFSWPPDLNDFKNYNLIYGWNATGKTVLSNLFRAMEKRQPITIGEMEIVFNGRKINSGEFSTDSTLPQVRVFNRNFIKENVFTSHGVASPIFFLGEESIEKQKQVDDLRRELENQLNNISEKQQEKTAKERELDNHCIERGKTIKELLSSSGSNPYNNYDKRSFRIKCEEMISSGHLAQYVLKSEEKERLKQQKEAFPKEKILSISNPFIDLKTLSSDLKQILATTVVSRVIQELKDDRELAQWTKDGLEKHKKGKTSVCLFCGQPVPAERLKRLEEHFNDQYIQFMADIDAKIDELQQNIEGTRNLQLPDKTNLYDHLANDYLSHCSELKKQISTYCETLEKLKQQLDEKRSKPFQSLSFDVNLPDISSIQVDEVNGVINQHNQETENFQQTVTSARRKLEESIVAESIDIYITKQKEINESDNAIKNIEGLIKDIQNKIFDLEQEIIEHRKPADDLNQDLRDYLGHDELKFEVKDNGYLITRNNQVAEALSEGEKTAIAFLYFLKSLKDKDFNVQKGVVVIDDPVSSLDSNALFHAFGYMKMNTKAAGQLFVFTHNFSLFRQVKNWFDFVNKRKKQQKKEAAFFQIVCKNQEGCRVSELRALDSLLLNYESEYHYLFSMVYQAANAPPESTDLAQFYHLPNIARRLLESFLAFRLPSKSGDLYHKLDAVSFDLSKKTRILRFLHTHSHDDQVDMSEHDISILAETPRILSDVLELIKVEDEKHYNEMTSIIAPLKTQKEEI